MLEPDRPGHTSGDVGPRAASLRPRAITTAPTTPPRRCCTADRGLEDAVAYASALRNRCGLRDLRLNCFVDPVYRPVQGSAVEAVASAAVRQNSGVDGTVTI
jgi:hypothetical protein